MSAKIIKYSSRAKSAVIERFLEREAFPAPAEKAAASVLAGIRKDGDKAVSRYCLKFDGARLKPADFAVTDKEIREAGRQITPSFRKAAAEAVKRVSRFARAGLRKNWKIPTPGGGTVGEIYTPLDRVGVYVPGGKAPLASTALMTAAIARVAGVPEIAACTPVGPDGTVNPFLLYALEKSGATEIYRVGGIQAIGMMAYGTDTFRKVQKIVGPGNAYVTAAKRQVYGHVSLDLVAGPSEIAVIADSKANPAYIAADLLSQAEHGTGTEKALLATTSMTLAKQVRKELDRQAELLSRKKTVKKVISGGMILAVTTRLADCVELCRRFAPEHLEVLTQKPASLVKDIRNAGAIFLGQWSPEPAGDFIAGPSHVLPTGGAACMFSGLTVDDFMKRSSVIKFTKKDLSDTLDAIKTFGEVEGLDAHSRSAEIRFDK